MRKWRRYAHAASTEGLLRFVLGTKHDRKDDRVVQNFEELSGTIVANFAGEAVADVEYWTDELDRWADMLVGPG